MAEYPRWKYHPTEPARIVQDADEESGLGEGWVNSPADVDKEPEVKRGRPKKVE